MDLMLFVEGGTLRAEFLLIFQAKSGKGRSKRDSTRRVGGMYRVTEIYMSPG